MVIVKTPEQIEGIRKSCRLLAHVMEQLVRMVKPGITTGDLDREAERLIREGGGKPAFKGYQSAPSGVPFPSSVCTSVNDIVVHGIANEYELKEGDLIGLDCGVNLNGYFSDMARTVAVGSVDAHKQKLIDVAKHSLDKGIDQIRPGKSIRAISQAIENAIVPHNFGIVRGFAGHGVGLQVHEDPWIPNYVSEELEDDLNFVMQPGHVFAIEPMITDGEEDVQILSDGWSVQTVDGSLSAHFEDTVLVTENGHEVLTRLSEIR